MEFLTPVKITWGFYKLAKQWQLISYNEEKKTYQVLIPVNNLIVEIKAEDLREYTKAEKKEAINQTMKEEKQRQERELAKQKVDSIVKAGTNGIIWAKK